MAGRACWRSVKIGRPGTDGELVAVLVDYLENADEISLSESGHTNWRGNGSNHPAGAGSMSVRDRAAF